MSKILIHGYKRNRTDFQNIFKNTPKKTSHIFSIVNNSQIEIVIKSKHTLLCIMHYYYACHCSCFGYSIIV